MLGVGGVDSAVLPVERWVPCGVLLQVGGLSQAAPQVLQSVDAVLGYLLHFNVNKVLELVCLGVQVLDSCEGALEDVDAVLDLVLVEPEEGAGNFLLGDRDEVALARVLAAAPQRRTRGQKLHQVSPSASRVMQKDKSGLSQSMEEKSI